MQRIVYTDNPVLREIAHDVEPAEIASTRIQTIIKNMKESLATEKFGVAIAAPQIAESVRIFVVAGKVFASLEDDEYDPVLYPEQTFINPEIVRVSKKQKMGDEGCLSVPGKYGTKVLRHEKITITYYDEDGDRHERGASDFLARIFQHEIDHLNGILYTDEALEVIEVDDELQPLEKK